jgi:signal transduction histidine kinase
MRERVERMGGELTIQSAPGAGSAIVVNVPLPPGQALSRAARAERPQWQTLFES